jgi:Quinohemoprotein amine dehydrogenase, alpha subunit domain III
MLIRFTKVVSGVFVAAAITACAEGPKGEKGDPGEKGPGFETGQSISAVQPTSVLLGRRIQVQISGFATAWNEQVQVAFGSGITVLKVTVASPTALVAEIEVASSAAPGVRTITVTQGTSIASFANVFEVKAPYLVQVLAPVTQLSATVARLQRGADSLRMPSSLDEIEFHLPDGLDAQIFAVTRDTADIFIATDRDVTPGAKEIGVVLFPGAADEYTFAFTLTVGAGSSSDAVVGTPVTGALPAFASKAYRFTSATAGYISITISGAGAGPVAFAIDDSGAFSGLLGQTLEATAFSVTADRVFYVVVFDFAGDAGQFTLSLSPSELTAEVEPNDAETQAQTLGPLPIVIGGSLTLEAADVVDVFKVTLGAEMIGKQLHFEMFGGEADVAVEVKPSGGSPIAFGPNLFDFPLTTPALAVAGEYLFTFALPSSLAFDGDYFIAVSAL